jgi:hypothetical protein
MYSSCPSTPCVSSRNIYNARARTHTHTHTHINLTRASGQYTAFYQFVEKEAAAGGLGADAVLHFGMHGTEEWLPGTPLGNTGRTHARTYARTCIHTHFGMRGTESVGEAESEREEGSGRGRARKREGGREAQRKRERGR